MIKKYHLLLLLLPAALLSTPVYAELVQLNQETITDSEEPFSRRVYSYDFDVTPDGFVVAVYARPVPGEDRAQIIYMAKAVGGGWPPESERIVLEEFGSVPSISTWIIFEPATAKSHISYIVNREYEDQIGLTHSHGLVYQTVRGGTVSEKNNVSPGGFHTRMQLDGQGNPIFIREYEIFTLDGINAIDPPFPKALRIQLRREDGNWSDREHILSLPEAEDYRLGNFLYDAETGRYHITYGDKNAVYLRNTYPTVNPPVTPDKTPVYFPPGSGHKLWYAYSDDLVTWQASLVDPSGDISENEFWTELELATDGTPYVASFRYKTDAQGIQQGSTNIIGYFKNDVWHIQTVAGKTTGASPSRAGMGAKLIPAAGGGFHAIWDSSPDKPIDAEIIPPPGETAGGITMYRHSPDGQHWAVRQVLFPFSLEGQARAKQYQDRLLVMGLGDARDARLVFGEFHVPDPPEPVFEVATDKMFYGAGEEIQLHVRLQGDNITLNNVHLLVAGPYNVDVQNQGALVPIPTTQWQYLGPDFQWHPVENGLLPATVPALPMVNLQAYFMTAPANAKTAPFAKPSRYRLYSAVAPAYVENDGQTVLRPPLQLGSSPTTGEPVFPQNVAAPLYRYDIHVCNQPACGEI